MKDTFDDRSENQTKNRLNRPFKSPLLKTSSKQISGGPPNQVTGGSPKTPTASHKQKNPFKSPLLNPNGDKIKEISHSSVKEDERDGISSQTPLNYRPKRFKLASQSKKINVEDLRQRERLLDAEIARLQQEGLCIEELDHQIDLLHRYNDIKDVAQIVMGRLAELEGVTVKVLHQKYDLPLCD